MFNLFTCTNIYIIPNYLKTVLLFQKKLLLNKIVQNTYHLLILKSFQITTRFIQYFKVIKLHNFNLQVIINHGLHLNTCFHKF